MENKLTILSDWHGVIDKRTFAQFTQMLFNYSRVQIDDSTKTYLQTSIKMWVQNKMPDFFETMAEYFKLTRRNLSDLKNYIINVELNTDVYYLYQDLIREGCKIIFLSDCPLEKAQTIVHGRYFNNAPMYFSCDRGIAKDDEFFFINPLHEHWLYPDRCLYIDDSSDNLHVPEILGYNVCLFTGNMEDIKTAIQKAEKKLS